MEVPMRSLSAFISSPRRAVVIALFTGLSVVLVATSDRRSTPTPAPASGIHADSPPNEDMETRSAVKNDGYTLFGSTGTNARFLVRLVSAPGIESLRPVVQDVADDLSIRVGTNVTVAPGTVAAHTWTTGEIRIALATSADGYCTGSRWVGCGYGWGPDGVVIMGKVWLKPLTLGYTSAQLHHLISHELGHVLNLAHHNDTYAGQFQVMHETSYDASAYRAGDLRGLRLMNARGRGFPQADFSYSVDGAYDPLSGDFDGDGRDDVFWYAPGTTDDPVWFGSSTRTFARGQSSYSVNGSYRPITGDFDGDGRDDVFWYAPGTTGDPVWFGSSTRSFTRKELAYSVDGTYQPAAGDFDGDGRADVLWYGSGSVHAVWFGRSDRTFDRGWTFTAPGGSIPVVGDFDGDGRSDVFLYGSDTSWFGRADRSFDAGVSFSVSAGFTPIVGNFDADRRADILWYRPGGAADILWHSAGRTFDSDTGLNLAGTYTPTAGDFDGDGLSDLFLYAAGGDVDPVWWGRT
jgi:FG-GAP-like repeat